MMDPPTSPAPTQSSAPPEIALCLELGRAYQAYGIPAHRFEDALSRICSRLGLEGEFFALPTAFFASLTRNGHQWTFIQRSPGGDVDLARLSDLQRTTDDLIAGKLSTEEARERVRSILAAPQRWSALTTTLCFGLGSAPAAKIGRASCRERV